MFLSKLPVDALFNLQKKHFIVLLSSFHQPLHKFFPFNYIKFFHFALFFKVYLDKMQPTSYIMIWTKINNSFICILGALMTKTDESSWNTMPLIHCLIH